MSEEERLWRKEVIRPLILLLEVEVFYLKICTPAIGLWSNPRIEATDAWTLWSGRNWDSIILKAGRMLCPHELCDVLLANRQSRM